LSRKAHETEEISVLSRLRKIDRQLATSASNCATGLALCAVLLLNGWLLWWDGGVIQAIGLLIEMAASAAIGRICWHWCTSTS
jgi:hypothetical protein